TSRTRQRVSTDLCALQTHLLDGASEWLFSKNLTPIQNPERSLQPRFARKLEDTLPAFLNARCKRFRVGVSPIDTSFRQICTELIILCITAIRCRAVRQVPSFQDIIPCFEIRDDNLLGISFESKEPKILVGILVGIGINPILAVLKPRP